MTTNTEELKGCPFCSSEVNAGMGYNFGKVYCSNEFCKIHNVYFYPDQWNTRAGEMKTIEHLREGLQKLFLEKSSEFMQKINDCTEEILIAFIAKYGVHPEDAIACYQDNKFWVTSQKLIDDESSLRNTILKLNKKYQKLLKFVKKIFSYHGIAYESIDIIQTLDDFSDEAEEILKEIGEL